MAALPHGESGEFAWKTMEISVRQSQELARFPVRFTHNGKPGRTATPNLQARPVLHGV
jgi:hypothetical protein